MPWDHDSQTSFRLVPDSRRGPYLIRIRWAEIGGRAEPVGIELHTALPPDLATSNLPLPLPGQARIPIGVGSLRSLRLGEVVDLERQAIAKWYRRWKRQHPGEEPAPIEQTSLKTVWTLDALLAAEARSFAESPRRGPDVTPAEYVKVAEVYRGAYREKNPTVAVQNHFKISYSAAAKRVQRARERGLLPPTGQGRARAKESSDE